MIRSGVARVKRQASRRVLVRTLVVGGLAGAAWLLSASAANAAAAESPVDRGTGSVLVPLAGVVETAKPVLSTATGLLGGVLAPATAHAPVEQPMPTGRTAVRRVSSTSAAAVVAPSTTAKRSIIDRGPGTGSRAGPRRRPYGRPCRCPRRGTEPLGGPARSPRQRVGRHCWTGRSARGHPSAGRPGRPAYPGGSGRPAGLRAGHRVLPSADLDAAVRRGAVVQHGRHGGQDGDRHPARPARPANLGCHARRFCWRARTCVIRHDRHDRSRFGHAGRASGRSHRDEHHPAPRRSAGTRGPGRVVHGQGRSAQPAVSRSHAG